jgi:C4-dicarboxylate transporter DctM subunit
MRENEGMEAIVIFSSFLIFMAMGMPIGTALGIAAVITIYWFDLGIAMLGVNFSSGIASFPLLAIPFFVLAGVILEKAGLAATIAHFFELVVGKAVGGLAMVAVLTCMFWGALSGSGPATTAAVGLILLAPMIKHGYDKHFAGATIANASDLSIVIPPSIAFIIYGNITSMSVSALFMAGIIPGLLTGAGTVLVAYLISRKRGYRGLERRGSLKEILIALKDSIWAILAPVIILGGIYTGIFTPTEAAVVAVFYSLIVAVFIYRSITFRDMIRILVDASVTSSVIMFIVVFAGIFTWAASVIGIIDLAAHAIIGISPNAVVMIILVNLLLLGLGMILDAISISYLIMPILIPVLAAFKIDPLWYGVIFISALAIGQATPPVGVNLFTAANLVKGELDSVARQAIPFVLMDVIVLIILSFVPWFSLYLPVKAGLYTP